MENTGIGFGNRLKGAGKNAFNSYGSVLIAVVAVSYTHLDVYKRQDAPHIYRRGLPFRAGRALQFGAPGQ